ncbi:MAG: carboxypeptidase regulatory-like domain-containing protein [Acidobacteria bacterium]|nr:carboxypeptidase regulatory-like domain-containing protein [Acidobacteriota bacterium]
MVQRRLPNPVLRSALAWAVAACTLLLGLAWLTKSREGSASSHPLAGAETDLPDPGGEEPGGGWKAERAPLVPVPPAGTAQQLPANGELEPLGAPCVVGVRVVRADTRDPIPGAYVKAYLSPLFASIPEASDEGKTREDGEARLLFDCARAPGTLDVYAWGGGAWGSVPGFQLREGAAEHITVEAVPAPMVKGVVRDRSTNQPIPGCRVSSYAMESLSWAPVVSGPDGKFVLPFFHPKAEAGIRVSSVGYGSEIIRLRFVDGGEWEIPGRPGMPALHGRGVPEVEVWLMSERVITGIVSDRSGVRVAEAGVEATGHYLLTDDLRTQDRATASVSEGGEFSITGLRSDISHVVTVSAQGRGMAYALVPPGQQLVDIGILQLPEQSLVRGLIETSTGEPLAGAGVTLVQSLPAPAQDPSFPRDCSCPLVVAKREVESDSEGRFEVRGMPAGETFVRVEVCGRSAFEGTVHVGLNTLLDPLVVEVRSGRLHGTVFLGREPVAGARVDVASHDTTSRATVLTDARGAFSVLGLKEGARYSVRAIAPGEGHTSIVSEGIELGGPPLILTLEQAH